MSGKRQEILDQIEALAQSVRDMDAPEMIPPMDRVPMQPITIAADGVVRFRENAIVRFLLDRGPFNMNHIAMLPGIPQEDRAQFAQLIGYSVSGYGDLDYALGVPEADTIAAAVWAAKDKP